MYIYKYILYIHIRIYTYRYIFKTHTLDGTFGFTLFTNRFLLFSREFDIICLLCIDYLVCLAIASETQHRSKC